MLAPSEPRGRRDTGTWLLRTTAAISPKEKYFLIRTKGAINSLRLGLAQPRGLCSRLTDRQEGGRGPSQYPSVNCQGYFGDCYLGKEWASGLWEGGKEGRC